MAPRCLPLYRPLGRVLGLSLLIVGPWGCTDAGKTPTPAAGAGKEAPPSLKEAEHLPVRLGRVPDLAPAPRPALDARRATRLKKHIARLADVDSPDYGLSPTVSGETFLPLAGPGQARAFLLTDHRLKPSGALRALVEAGPDALPLLLAALGDRTPTKLTIEHRSSPGAMCLANELWGNPVNPAEARVLGRRGKRPPGQETEKLIESYTVKVGDVCLVAVGQIVGRRYQAVRYQPTACIVINSPTEDAGLRKQVRAIWSSEDPARHLLKSLLLDYATEGNYKEGEPLNEWYVGSDLQVAAAKRLLYYFPKETAPMIARRLRGLRVEGIGPGPGRVHTEKELAAWARREVANGARTDELVRAVSWCREPAVRDAVRSLFRRTGDVAVLLAALPALDDGADAQLIRARIASFLGRLPEDGGGAYGDGYNLLVAAERRLGAAARPLFVRYLEGSGPVRRYAVCQALQSTKEDWSVELLGPLLDDKRPVGGYAHPASKDDEENRVDIRVCDAAAETLSRRRPGLRFEMVGTEGELDRQVRAIREQLGHRRR